jgi:NADPH:quinone reductase
MKAIVFEEHGGPEVLQVKELDDPRPGADEVLIRVKAFGLNHADTYMRSGVWSFGIPVLGIEAVGTVEEDASGSLAPGTPVVALVGGMARTRPGSYAELVAVPASNVAAVETSMGWPELAAIPEVYATAWWGLFANLGLQAGESVLVRGATASVGRAAVSLAVDSGARVIATSRNPDSGRSLRELGAEQIVLDDGEIAARVRELVPSGVDAVLDLVGNPVLRDSLRCVRARGRVCQIGFLGGLDPVADFNPLADLPSGVQLSTFASAFVLGAAEFPLSEIPLQEIVAKAERGVLAAKPARVFAFEEIADAHRLMDAGRAGGKLVVEVG